MPRHSPMPRPEWNEEKTQQSIRDAIEIAVQGYSFLQLYYLATSIVATCKGFIECPGESVLLWDILRMNPHQ